MPPPLPTLPGRYLGAWSSINYVTEFPQLPLATFQQRMSSERDCARFVEPLDASKSWMLMVVEFLESTLAHIVLPKRFFGCPPNDDLTAFLDHATLSPRE